MLQEVRKVPNVAIVIWQGLFKGNVIGKTVMKHARKEESSISSNMGYVRRREIQNVIP